MQNIAVGDSLPVFSLPNLQGEISSSETLTGGPAAIIFWSTWSPRSEEILEDFRQYHRQYSPNGLKVLAVNINGEKLSARQRKEIMDYLARMNLPFTVILDENLKVFSSVGVVAHPSVMIIDDTGKITYVLDGYPRTRRDELKDNILKVLGLYVEPPPEKTVAGHKPKGRSLQYHSMGKKLLDMGQMEKALNYFNRSAEIDPEYIDPVIMATRTNLLLGHVEQAEEKIKQVDTEFINRNDVRYLLGYLMMIKGKISSSEALFRQIHQKSPKEAWGLWGLGLIALYQEDFAAAADLMEEAHDIMPRNYEAEAYVQNFFSKNWMMGKTLEDEDRFVTIFPKLVNTRERYKKMLTPGGIIPGTP